MRHDDDVKTDCTGEPARGAQKLEKASKQVNVRSTTQEMCAPLIMLAFTAATNAGSFRIKSVMNLKSLADTWNVFTSAKVPSICSALALHSHRKGRS
jgi:hypothetical protein